MTTHDLLLAYLALVAAPGEPASDLDARLEASFASIVEEGNALGLAAGVRVPDGEVVVRGFGRVRRNDDAVPDGDTIYEIGSITKAFTGILLADACERGLVKLDDPIQRHLPDGVTVLDDEGAIRLRHLATHTSGLPRMPDNLVIEDPLDPYAAYDDAKLHAYLAELVLDAAPGDRYAYSNLGAGLLGSILARRHGFATYEEVVVARVARPLGLTDTAITLDEERRARFADPVSPLTRPWRFDALAGCGAMRSTVNELLQFAGANLEPAGSPLGAALRRSHAVLHPFDGGGGVAYGWHVRESGVVWHNGQTGGYHGFLAFDPASGFAIAVLASAALGGAAIDRACVRLIEDLGEAAREEPPARCALLVGIGDYPDELGPAWRDLPGASRDPDLVKELLVERFGFLAAEIHVLKDEEATHEAIVRAFHDVLIARAGPETEAVFWFSGHGSRVPDVSGVAGAEPDAHDSTLLAWDSRVDGRNGEFDVTDDELASLLAALTRKTPRVTVVTDSCHSGGVVRGGERARRVRTGPDGARPLDRALLEPFWPTELPFLDDDVPLRVDPGRYVHVAACEAHQQAVESDRIGEPDSMYGLLTLFLTHVLRHAQPGDTYRKVIDHTAGLVASVEPAQTVRREGAIDRVVFEGAFGSRPPGHRARVVPGRPGRIRVDAGRLHGLRLGSKLSVRRLWDGAEVGRATVDGVRYVTATATWEGDGPTLTTLELLASEVERPGVRGPLPVHVGHPALAAALPLDELNVTLARDGLGVHRLDVEPSGAAPGEPAKVVFRAPGGAAVWPGPSEDEVRADWRERALDRLPEVLEAERRYLDVAALVATPGDLPVEARFSPLEPRDLEMTVFRDGREVVWEERTVEARVVPHGAAGRGVGVWEYLAHVEVEAEHRSLARLDVTNRAEHDVYVSVLSATDDRAVRVVWPPSGYQDFVIGAGETRPTFVVLTVPEGRTRPLRDRYLVIATRTPADFEALIQPATHRGDGDGHGRVPAVLASAVAGARTRGDLVYLAGDDAYGLASVDVLVSAVPAEDPAAAPPRSKK